MSLELQRSSGMQQTVRLLGDLGERYGSEHKYYGLKSPAEAIKLLCINHPEFQQELISSHEDGVGYKVIQAGLELDYDDLALPLGQNDLIVTPVVAGSGGSTGKIIAGVALIAAALFIPGAQVLGFAGFNAALAGTAGTIVAGIGTAIGAIGAGLALSGVAEMISPQPQLPSFDGFDGAQRFSGVERFGGAALGSDPQVRGVTGGQSYAYNGPANVAGVGGVIPVAYGNVIIGSSLISARIEVTNEGSDPNADVTNRSVITPGPETITLGGEKLTTAFTELGNGTKAQLNEQLVTVFNQTDSKKLFDLHIAMASGSERVFYLPKHNDDLERLDFIFRLQRGLYDRASGANSTKVYGSFTYEIQVYSAYIENRRLTHRSQTRITGVLDATDPNASEATRATQKYRWKQRVKFGKASPDDEDLYIVVKIIDFDVFTGDDGSPAPTLKVHAIGVNIT
jgi:predicted phage tail protein